VARANLTVTIHVYLSADCSLPVHANVVLAIWSVINVGLSFMYISASDLHHFVSYWIITIQHSLVCEFTCPDTFTTRLCSVFAFSIICLLPVLFLTLADVTLVGGLV